MSIRPYLHVYQSVVQPVQTHRDTPLSMDRKIVDTLGEFNPAPGQNIRYYPTIPGWYDCFGQAAFSNADLRGDRSAQFNITGVETDHTPYGGQHPPRDTGFIASFALCKATVFCNGRTDYIQLTGAQSSGVTLDTWYLAGHSHSYMIIQWVAP